MFSKRIFNIIIVSGLSVPLVSIAQTIKNPLKVQSFSELVEAFLGLMTTIGIPIAGFFFVYAGFKFVTSQGDPKKLDTAKTMFLWTCIGTALIIGARVVMTVLQGTIKSLQ